MIWLWYSMYKYILFFSILEGPLKILYNNLENFFKIYIIIFC